MFEFNPDMVGEDDADADADYTRYVLRGQKKFIPRWQYTMILQFHKIWRRQ